MVDDDGCTSVGCTNENEYDAEPGSPGFLGYLNNDNDEVQQQLEYLTEKFQTTHPRTTTLLQTFGGEDGGEDGEDDGEDDVEVFG